MEKNYELENKVDEKTILQNNRTTNKEKLLFFNFLMNNTKIEAHLEQLQSYLYWNALLEYLTWLVMLLLFISSPSKMAIIWIFFYHNARATIGLFILRHIPKTHQVVENLKDYENSSLEDIQKTMEQNYVSLIHESQKVLKPLMIIYFVLTVISILVDLIVFGIIASNLNDSDNQQKEFFCLVAIVVFLICDLVYFGFIGSLRFSFPPETLIPIRRAIIGFFDSLKFGIASGFKGVINKVTRRTVTQAVQNAPNV